MQLLKEMLETDDCTPVGNLCAKSRREQVKPKFRIWRIGDATTRISPATIKESARPKRQAIIIDKEQIENYSDSFPMP